MILIQEYGSIASFTDVMKCDCLQNDDIFVNYGEYSRHSQRGTHLFRAKYIYFGVIYVLSTYNVLVLLQAYVQLSSVFRKLDGNMHIYEPTDFIHPFVGLIWVCLLLNCELFFVYKVLDHRGMGISSICQTGQRGCMYPQYYYLHKNYEQI